MSRRTATVLASAAALVLIVAVPVALWAQSVLATFETDQLVIETAAGESHEFEIEVATTRAQRSQGLMFRRSLAPDTGMLFIYPASRPIGMWMKNTFIPLDMLFIDESGLVVKIVERTVPHSLKSIDSGEAVLAVMEVNSGVTSKLGIEPGDRVIHSAFNRTAQD